MGLDVPLSVRSGVFEHKTLRADAFNETGSLPGSSEAGAVKCMQGKLAPNSLEGYPREPYYARLHTLPPPLH